MIVAVELGVLYAVMALGVYLTFRILDFPDLTVDGSFTTGGATAATLILSGTPPVLATAAGFVTGFVAGIITGLLHTKGRINGLLAGILTQIGLYSINLRIMGSANVSLLRADTFFSGLREQKLLGTWVGPAILAVVLVLRIGRALRTGEVPLYRTRLNRMEAGDGRFFALVALNGVAFLAMFVIAADLIFGLGLRSR